MIDRQALSQEVERARAARNEAEEACGAIEELLWEMRYPHTWRRLAQLDDSPVEVSDDAAPAARTH